MSSEELNDTVKHRSSLIFFLLALGIILVDQISKILVYKFMYIHQEITILGYGDGLYGFKLHYLLNPGMAFGLRWDSEFGKLALTFFRIIAMAGITFYLARSVKRKAHTGFLISLSLILGGAVGNVIDSTFYGVLLDNQPSGSVTPWFHGQVIDMLFFPLFEFNWPSWVPYLGGENFLFFSPVFNIADSSIFIGVANILLFQKKYFKEQVTNEPFQPTDHQSEVTSDLNTVAPMVSLNPLSPPASKEEDPNG